jgi:hypothetical protein
MSSGFRTARFALVLALLSALSPNMSIASTDGKLPVNKHAAQPCEAVIGSEDHANGHRWVTAKILINASPHVVWQTVHEERRRDPDLAYSKVLNCKDNDSTLEQKFTFLPVIGTAVCVMHDIEIPNQRIDYTMVSSDHFKAMEGCWELTPAQDGSSTYLSLATYCDMGFPVPRSFLDGITARKLQRRLSNVKAMAEAEQLRVAQQKVDSPGVPLDRVSAMVSR